MGLEMRNTCRADVTFNILCLAGVYDNITTIAIPYVFMNASRSHSRLTQDGRSPLMSVIKRDIPKEDKVAMVRLLLDRGADMFAEDNVSVSGMRMCAFSSLRRDVN